jgi:hypothetical protein
MSRKSESGERDSRAAMTETPQVWNYAADIGYWRSSPSRPVEAVVLNYCETKETECGRVAGPAWPLKEQVRAGD